MTCARLPEAAGGLSRAARRCRGGAQYDRPVLPALGPSDWLLLLFGTDDQPLDRVRIQKTMFLCARRSKAAEPEKYQFKPYHYGPFSFDIYPDLDRMVHAGLLREEPPAAGLSSPGYALTAAGAEQAA